MKKDSLESGSLRQEMIELAKKTVRFYHLNIEIKF